MKICPPFFKKTGFKRPGGVPGPVILFLKQVRGPLAAFFLFISLWALLSVFFEPYIVPSPLAVIGSPDRFCDPVFLENFRITAVRVLIGFSAAFFLGSGIGIFSAALKINAAMETFLVLFQVIPGLILGLILLLIFGVGSTAPVCLIVTLTTPMTAVTTANSLMRKNRMMEDVIRSFNGKFRHVLRDLYLPALVPAMKTNLTLGLVMSLKIILLGEFLAADNGIGYLLNISKIYFNMKDVFFYLLVILLIIVVFQVLVNLIFMTFLKKYLYSE